MQLGTTSDSKIKSGMWVSPLFSSWVDVNRRRCRCYQLRVVGLEHLLIVSIAISAFQVNVIVAYHDKFGSLEQNCYCQ